MLDFSIKRHTESGETWLETSLSGKPLLTTPQLNKGTAFTVEERLAFGLTGKLPIQVETLSEQVSRAYQQYRSYRSKLKKHIYLTDLHDRNQVLFYKLVSEHLSEMLPMIYTPIVGKAVKRFSHEFRQPRGLYIAYPEINYIDQILDNRSNPQIKLIVVTDGEGVLGIGDQGVGGMDIPVAKLMVYSLCGGIDPLNTLPIIFDVGTNNQELLNDPLYLGWRHPRIQGAEYDRFVDRVIDAIERKFPRVFLHWEDFGRANAQRYLQRYQGRICTFNDDIQGTGIVTLAALLAAVQHNHSQLGEQRIVIYGAGTAGAGITNQIYTALIDYFKVDAKKARQQFWLIDRQGLLLNDSEGLTPAQQPFARDRREIAHWQLNQSHTISLYDVIHNVKPTILIGCSGNPGAFNDAVIREMAKHVKNPIIFPLSNPTENAEATPKEILQWTQGRALVATGSPFRAIEFQHHRIPIAQCNNALVFPGIGLGLIAIQARQLSDGMIWDACETLAAHSPILKNPKAPLLPPLADAPKVGKQIAIAVAKRALDEGCCWQPFNGKLETLIDQHYWEPHYLAYRHKLPTICEGEAP